MGTPKIEVFALRVGILGTVLNDSAMVLPTQDPSRLLLKGFGNLRGHSDPSLASGDLPDPPWWSWGSQTDHKNDSSFLE